MKTGEIIKKLRKERGWNQSELGEKIGLSYGGIAAIEQGRNDPSASAVIKLSSIFGVSTDYILTGKESTGEISDDEREILEILRKDEEFNTAVKNAAGIKKR